jgi:uncharacterized protein YacL
MNKEIKDIKRPSHTLGRNDFKYFLFYYGLFLFGLSLIIDCARTGNVDYIPIIFYNIIITHIILFYLQYKEKFIFSELNDAFIGSRIYKKYESKIVLGSIIVIISYIVLGYYLYKLYSINTNLFDNLLNLILFAFIFSIGGKFILERYLNNLFNKNRKKDF